MWRQIHSPKGGTDANGHVLEITPRFASGLLNATKCAPFIATCLAAITTGRFRPRTTFGLGPTTTFPSYTAGPVKAVQTRALHIQRKKHWVTPDFLNAIFLELKTDDVETMRQKITAFGVKVLPTPDSHLYFQAPGGQVFRLVGVERTFRVTTDKLTPKSLSCEYQDLSAAGHSVKLGNSAGDANICRLEQCLVDDAVALGQFH